MQPLYINNFPTRLLSDKQSLTAFSKTQLASEDNNLAETKAHALADFQASLFSSTNPNIALSEKDQLMLDYTAMLETIK